MEQNAEDLKAVERRLTEVIGWMQPGAGRWRLVLVVSSVATMVGAWLWLSDPATMEVRFVESLYNHSFFSASLLLLLALFLAGIHKRVVAPSIIASRCRATLADFNMSCDDSGRLILKPRPSSP